MPGILQKFFQINTGLFEGGLGLGLRGKNGIFQIRLFENHPHSLAAPASPRLDHDRITNFFRDFQKFRVLGVDRPFRRRKKRDASVFRHEFPGLDFVPHHFYRFGVGPDKFYSHRLAYLGEVGVFRQKTIAGMNGVSSGNFSRGNYGGDVQIGFGCRGGADANGLVGLFDVKGFPVNIGMNGHRFNSHFAAGADNPDGDLASIGNQNDPVRTKSAVDRLIIPDTEDSMPFVLETIRILRSRLNVPLIGFSGAPFTLATYMIEGGSTKNFLNTKKIMFQNPGLFHLLMDKITATVVSYLLSQIKAGAQAVQLFDTWAGTLSPEDYKKSVLPYVKRAVAELKREGVPVIYFLNECAALLREIKKTGADVIGVDWRIDLKDAVKGLGKKFAVQGNLDPCALFLPVEDMEERVKDILCKGEFAKGHIFNLGHGILPECPVENAAALVKAVHRFSER